MQNYILFPEVHYIINVKEVLFSKIAICKKTRTFARFLWDEL